MGNVKYNDPVFQEIKVKSANNRKIIFELPLIWQTEQDN